MCLSQIAITLSSNTRSHLIHHFPGNSHASKHHAIPQPHILFKVSKGLPSGHDLNQSEDLPTSALYNKETTHPGT